MITTRTRITFGLVCLLTSVLMIAMVMGIIPDHYRAVLEGRKALCEAIAVNGSVLVTGHDLARLQAVLQTTVQRNPDIVSAAVRRADGALLVDVANHSAHWTLLPGDDSTETQVQVPVREGGQKWGTIELRFHSAETGGLFGSIFGGRLRMVVFISAASFLLFLVYLKKMLDYLDPSHTVPGHVRSALDTLAEGLLVLDARERLVLCNQAFASLLGKAPEKIVGKSAAALPWTTDATGEAARRFPWSIALEEKRLVRDALLRMQTASGEVRTFMVNCSPVLGHNGQYRGVLASFDDVTQLEQKEIELRKSKQIAEEASRTKSQFLANMSHEIRTPMNAILGYTDLLRRGMGGAEHDRAKYLDTIYHSGEHLLHLINDILDLSKIEAGRLEVEQIATCPHSIIGEVVLALGIPAQQRGLSLAFSPQGQLPESIQSDPLRLRQIVTNLVGNALKFTKQGGVTVRAELVAGNEQASSEKVGSEKVGSEKVGSRQSDRSGRRAVGREDVGSETLPAAHCPPPTDSCPPPTKSMLKIDVVDTGVGIPEESLEKIFLPFTQADNSVTRNFGGTGLGLTISRRFAEAMGGTLTATSQVGQGSTFTLTIPTGPLDAVRMLSPEDIASPVGEPEVDKQPLRRPRSGKVLVVDDGEANRQLIKLVLTRSGVTVVEAENGQEALERAQADNFDLILMDMQMPVMDGYTAARRLRDRGLTIPIVALTGNAMKGDEEKCHEAGCSGFLSKPVSLDKLMELVVAVLGEAPDEEAGKVGPASLLAPAPLGGATKLDDSDPQRRAGAPARCAEAVELVPPYAKRAPLVSTLWSDDPEFQEIVAGFVFKLRSQVPLLSNACKAKDWKTAANMAHWLKGSVGTLGFGQITASAKALEQCAKAGQAEGAEQSLREVIEWIDSIELPGYEAEALASEA
jgi:PAS domain S-box-containing protein